MGTALADRNPYKTQLKMTFTKTGWPTRTSYAFWDGPAAGGKQRFVVRAYFPTTGTWSWSTTCDTPAYCGSGTTTPSLLTSGSVSVGVYGGPPNPLYQFGELGLLTSNWNDGGGNRSWSALYETGSGKHFMWIGDTAWVGPMRSTTSEWSSYLANRKSNGVTILQLGPAPYWAGSTDMTDSHTRGQPAVRPDRRLHPAGQQSQAEPLPELPTWPSGAVTKSKIQLANDTSMRVLVRRPDGAGRRQQQRLPLPGHRRSGAFRPLAGRPPRR